MRVNTCFVTFAAIFAFCCTACSDQMVGSGVTALASHKLTRPSMRSHWTATPVGQFADPYGVAVGPTCTGGTCTVVVADPGSKKVFALSPNGSLAVLLDAAQMGGTFDPQGVSVDSDGNVFVADKEHWNNAALGSYIEQLRPTGRLEIHPDSEIRFPLYYRSVAAFAFTPLLGAAYGAAASRQPLTDRGHLFCHRYIQKHDACPFSTTPFNDPYGIAVDERNQVYVADPRDKKAYRVVNGGVHDLGMTFVDPYGIAVTPDGQYVYVADAGAKKVYERSPDGTWGAIGTFADPYGVAVSRDRTVWVADPGSKQVWKLSP
jgi:DNA-binding beta-propeller fold protein YncE